MVTHYYLFCPQPELTLGTTSHTDPGVVTILLQDRIGSLQVNCDGRWLDVKSAPGALVIDIGDILQIVSK
uniref:Uncharacterized protein MANES_15G133500 n=1 Tax=Rhizophora mucronata TaxID=61149 RepID=A0A2P2QRG1_RHIMU